jgi:hypothetical protein
VAAKANAMPPLAQPSNNNLIDAATLELLAKWRAEDATDDPEELREAEQELAEFKKTMNENRLPLSDRAPRLAAEP